MVLCVPLKASQAQLKVSPYSIFMKLALCEIGFCLMDPCMGALSDTSASAYWHQSHTEDSKTKQEKDQGKKKRKNGEEKWNSKKKKKKVRIKLFFLLRTLLFLLPVRMLFISTEHRSPGTECKTTAVQCSITLTHMNEWMNEWLNQWMNESMND